MDIYRWSLQQLQLTVLACGRAVVEDVAGEDRGEACPRGRTASAAAAVWCENQQQRPPARTRMGVRCWGRQRSQRPRSRLGWCLALSFGLVAPFCRNFRCSGTRIDVCLVLSCLVLSVDAVCTVFLLVLAVLSAG